ncbi:hypothetical protein TSOC_014045, partial [Tetrabaena socialis]
ASDPAAASASVVPPGDKTWAAALRPDSPLLAAANAAKLPPADCGLSGELAEVLLASGGRAQAVLDASEGGCQSLGHQRRKPPPPWVRTGADAAGRGAAAAAAAEAAAAGGEGADGAAAAAAAAAEAGAEGGEEEAGAEGAEEEAGAEGGEEEAGASIVLCTRCGKIKRIAMPAARILRRGYVFCFISPSQHPNDASQNMQQVMSMGPKEDAAAAAAAAPTAVAAAAPRRAAAGGPAAAKAGSGKAELGWAALVRSPDDMIMLVTTAGQGLLFRATDVILTGRAARGVKGASLGADPALRRSGLRPAASEAAVAAAAAAGRHWRRQPPWLHGAATATAAAAAASTASCPPGQRRLDALLDGVALPQQRTAALQHRGRQRVHGVGSGVGLEGGGRG